MYGPGTWPRARVVRGSARQISPCVRTARIRVHARANVRAREHKQNTHARTNTNIHNRTHTHIHTHTHTTKQKQAQTYTHTQAYTHLCAHRLRTINARARKVRSRLPLLIVEGEDESLTPIDARNSFLDRATVELHWEEENRFNTKSRRLFLSMGHKITL